VQHLGHRKGVIFNDLHPSVFVITIIIIVIIRGINSKDEQGNDNIIAARRQRQLHSN